MHFMVSLLLLGLLFGCSVVLLLSDQLFSSPPQIEEIRKERAKEKLRKMEERRAFRESRVYQEARSIGGVLVSCCHWTETPLLKHH